MNEPKIPPKISGNQNPTLPEAVDEYLIIEHALGKGQPKAGWIWATKQKLNERFEMLQKIIAAETVKSILRKKT